MYTQHDISDEKCAMQVLHCVRHCVLNNNFCEYCSLIHWNSQYWGQYCSDFYPKMTIFASYFSSQCAILTEPRLYHAEIGLFPMKIRNHAVSIQDHVLALYSAIMVQCKAFGCYNNKKTNSIK